jgi:nucleotide-binding universal stress UspA family protein
MKNLLVPVDLSEISNTVISRAAYIARFCTSKIWLLHVLSPDLVMMPFNVDRRILRDETAKELHQQRHQLRELAEQLWLCDLDAYPYLRTGDVGKSILKEARRIDADLIIMGTHRHGNVYHALFGGVGQKISRLAVCPVMKVAMHETQPCEFWTQKLLGVIK